MHHLALNYVQEMFGNCALAVVRYQQIYYQICRISISLEELRMSWSKWNFYRCAWFKFSLNPIQDESFRGCSRRKEGEGAKKRPQSVKSVTHFLQWWNLPQLYQRRSKKLMNYVAQHLSSADISIFSLETSKFCYIKKYSIDCILNIN